MRPILLFVALLTICVEFSAQAGGGATNAQPVSLGELDSFWRYSATLGPVLETGYSLVKIPDYMLLGDFPYRKRPYSKEVPFADHLSVVRLLGGYFEKSEEATNGSAAHPRDLAYRGTDGKIHYRMNLLKPRLQPYLDCGYTNLTLVLDNVPWCFPQKPGLGMFGQSSPPRDPQEWGDFIKEVCKEVVKIAGPDVARNFRFRVGTENNGLQRFNGTQDEYLRHYDFTAAAVTEVIPGAEVGPFNISGISVRGIDRLHNVNAFALSAHCLHQPNLANGKIPTPFDWVAYSRYFRPGDDPEWHAGVCRQVWEEFERREPGLKGVSREIHEFGVAPFGEVSKGDFVSVEPGALGAAETCQLMWLLKAAGINRLWHWNVYNTIKGHTGESLHLFTSQAWLLAIMERMAGGQSYLFSPLDASPSRAEGMMAGSFKPDATLLMLSAYNKNIASHAPETVRFRIPPELLHLGSKTARYVSLTQQTSVFDRIRGELNAAGLLKSEFATRPDRVGSLREMGTGRDAEAYVGNHWDAFTNQWVKSLTLQSLDPGIGQIENGPDGMIVSARLAAPQVLVIELQ